MRRRIGTILLLGGSAAILWCLSVLLTATLYQWYESRRIEHWPHARVSQWGALSLPAAPRSVPKLHEVIGELEIPRLHVSTVVMEGDDTRTLRLGAGHVPWTALPGRAGNVGIAAHRDTFFRPLRNIARNDRIALITPQGEFDYAVDSTEIVAPAAVRVLQASTHPELTLVTCYPFYYIGAAPLRFIVHARLIAEPNPANPARPPS